MQTCKLNYSEGCWKKMQRCKTLLPCLVPRCGKPAALDLPATLAGTLCCQHLALVTGSDISELDRQAQCIRCDQPGIRHDVCGSWCFTHVPPEWRKARAKSTGPKRKPAFLIAAERRQIIEGWDHRYDDLPQ